MKKKVVGRIMILVMLMIATVLSNVPMRVSASTNDNNRTVIKVISDSINGKTLKAGDTYKIQIEASDHNLYNLNSVGLFELFDLYDTTEFYNHSKCINATSVIHDESKHCYLITFEGTVEDKPGRYTYNYVSFKYDNGLERILEFSPKDYGVYYIIDDSTQDRLVAVADKVQLKTGENSQVRLTYIKSGAEVTGGYWFSEDDAIATVDQTGKVTAKSEGKVAITSVIKGVPYTTQVYVTNNETSGNYLMQSLNNNITVQSANIDGKNISAGNEYKIVLSVSDSNIINPTSAGLMLYYNYNDGDFKTTDIQHNEDLHSYTITFEGTLPNQKCAKYYIAWLHLYNDYGEKYEMHLPTIIYSVVSKNQMEQPSATENETQTKPTEAVTVQPADEKAVTDQTAEEATQTAQSGKQTPQTGDTFQPVYVVVAVISCGIIAVALLILKKKRCVR